MGSENLFQLQNGSKQFGERILFDRAQFSVNQNEHIGVIGPNGAGKTTLFKILTGNERLDSGEIIKMNGLRIGYLEQESDWTLDQNSEDYLTEKCLTPIWELKQMGLEIGLLENHFKSPLSSLSGGYRMRMKLLEILGQQPDLMLLDEPTNFLDLESIIVLEKFLQDYKGAFLLISHDREFLRRTTEYTLEIEGGEITKFPGHIDDYFEYKNEIQLIKAQQAANLESKRKHLQEFIDRFRAKATKARQAQSRMKQLGKLESIEIKSLPLRSRIQLPAPLETGKEVLTISKMVMGYQENKVPKPILKDVNIKIEKGQKVGVVGYNGAGKSTLLKTISGKIEPLSGDLIFGHKVEFSYFAQHLTDELILEDTVLDSLQRKAYRDTTNQQILNIAGSLLFSGDDIHKRVKFLSGGEKTRVALGQMLLQKKPLLIMDEPTNHLDFDTVNALAEALQSFQGTLILVSHDRSFIKRVSNRILEIRNGQVELYPGTYDDYLWSLENGSLAFRNQLDPKEKDHKSALDSMTSSIKNSAESMKFNYKEVTKKLNSEIKELQKQIMRTEEVIFLTTTELSQLNSELIISSGTNAQKIAINIASMSRKIEESEDVLLSQMETLDAKEKELSRLRVLEK